MEKFMANQILIKWFRKVKLSHAQNESRNQFDKHTLLIWYESKMSHLLMLIWPESRTGQYRVDNNREDPPHFRTPVEPKGRKSEIQPKRRFLVQVSTYCFFRLNFKRNSQSLYVSSQPRSGSYKPKASTGSEVVLQQITSDVQGFCLKLTEKINTSKLTRKFVFD